ncbi:MAG: RNA polymerase sigma factor [Verrucomicrobiia bacterium]
MRTLLDIVRACQSTNVLHVRLRYAEELITTVRPSLYKFVRRGCPENFVDDVLQDVLLGIATGVRRFEGDSDAAVWKWCYGIARHKIADKFRSEFDESRISLDEGHIARVVDVLEASHTKSPRELLELKEAVEVLRVLSPMCQELLWRRLAEGWSFEELANDMGKSPDAVRMAVNRCKEEAEKLLGAIER